MRDERLDISQKIRDDEEEAKEEEGVEDEKDEAQQKLLEEFEEMESLEQRVNKLKERREALKTKKDGLVELEDRGIAKGGGEPDVRKDRGDDAEEAEEDEDEEYLPNPLLDRVLNKSTKSHRWQMTPWIATWCTYDALTITTDHIHH